MGPGPGRLLPPPPLSQQCHGLQIPKFSSHDDDRIDPDGRREIRAEPGWGCAEPGVLSKSPPQEEGEREKTELSLAFSLKKKERNERSALLWQRARLREGEERIRSERVSESRIKAVETVTRKLWLGARLYGCRWQRPSGFKLNTSAWPGDERGLWYNT